MVPVIAQQFNQPRLQEYENAQEKQENSSTPSWFSGLKDLGSLRFFEDKTLAIGVGAFAVRAIQNLPNSPRDLSSFKWNFEKVDYGVAAALTLGTVFKIGRGAEITLHRAWKVLENTSQDISNNLLAVVGISGLCVIGQAIYGIHDTSSQMSNSAPRSPKYQK